MVEKLLNNLLSQEEIIIPYEYLLKVKIGDQNYSISLEDYIQVLVRKVMEEYKDERNI